MFDFTNHMPLGMFTSYITEYVLERYLYEFSQRLKRYQPELGRSRTREACLEAYEDDNEVGY